METLTCEECGCRWERQPKGGVKPKTCSAKCHKARKSRLDAQYYQQNREKTLSNVARNAEKNQERIKAYQKEYYQSRKEELKGKAALYRLNNIDKVTQSQRDYYLANRESIIKSVTEYAKRNPEKARRWAAMRNARARGAVEREAVDKKVLAERYGRKCHICGGQIPENVDRFHPLYFTMDHVVPLAEGGAHTYENVKPAHASCNKQKSAKLSGWENIRPIIPHEFKD